MRAQTLGAVLLSSLAIAACGGKSSSSTPAGGDAKPVLKSNATLAEIGLDPTAIDKSVSPCDDFYQFACGGWLARTEIPSDQPRWVRSFSVIQEENETVLRTILDKAGTEPDAPDHMKKIGSYYRACMDETAIDAAGMAPIEPLLKKARAVTNVASVMKLVTELHAHRIWPLWDISAEQDFKNATTVIAYLDQNGLGLPDRDFYFDEARAPLREFYVGHVERMLTLTGMKPDKAKQAAVDVMEIETELAKVSKTKVERRDPSGLYNKMDRAGLKKVAKSITWDKYFAGLGVPALGDANVTAPAFFGKVSDLLTSVKADKWRNYLQWVIVSSSAMELSKPFVDERFGYFKAITGTQELEPRWKRCVNSTNGALGELVALPYVEARFGGKSREDAEMMVNGIKAAFGANLEKLTWMDAPTRQRAAEKLDSMIFKIGYPETPRPYEFAISDAHASNQLAAQAWEMKRQLGKMGKPVDRKEWGMSAPIVNAYYNPLINEMVFPAGILQPPFYSAKFSEAVNLGGMGMVVGHELTHGFDDQGAQFAADGNLKNWWEPEVGKKFKEKTQCVVRQYSAYEPLPGIKLNGELTQGENIADIGGLKMAFSAYRTLRAGKPPVVADGYTEDQQFFLAHAQAWCGKDTPEFQKMLVTIDPHSPPRFRVNGPLENTPEFAAAFSCKVGQRMRPANACQVW